MQLTLQRPRLQSIRSPPSRKTSLEPPDVPNNFEVTSPQAISGLRRTVSMTFLTAELRVELDRKNKEELRRKMSFQEEEKRKLVGFLGIPDHPRM